MKHKLQSKVSRISTLSALTAFALLVPTKFVAADIIDDAQEGVNQVNNGGSSGTAEDLLRNITNALLFLIGAVSVIMIIIGAIRYVVSSGDQQAAANARNTILYSVIGLIVAVAAWGIISFVLGWIYDGSSAGGSSGTGGGTGPIAD